MKPGVRAFIVALSLVFLPVSVSATDAQAVEDSDNVAVKQAEGNAEPSLRVDAAQLTAVKLGERAPAGSLFLVLTGSLKNNSSDAVLPLPRIEQTLFLSVASGPRLAVHELSQDTADPLWGDVTLAPGEERRFEIVFKVPSELSGDVSLHFDNPSYPAVLPVSPAAPAPAVESAEPPPSSIQPPAATSVTSPLAPPDAGTATPTAPPSTEPAGKPETAVAPGLHLETEDLKSGDPIGVLFEGLAGNAKDWITIAASGSADNQHLQWHYTEGQRSGRMAFDGLSAGPYEIRVYFNDSYQVEARLAFTVASKETTAVVPSSAPSPASGLIELEQESGTADQPITVRWQGFPGNDADWIALAESGSSDDSNGIDYFKLNGRQEGRHVFDKQPPGDYELRAYFNNSYKIEDRLRFTVAASTGRAASRGLDVPGLTNVATRALGTFAQAAEGWEVLFDGNAVHYDETQGNAVLSSDWPNRIWLARPYTIDRVRFLLCDFDQRTYKYRLQGSPDGVAWNVLAESSNARGWQEISLSAQAFVAFRLTDFGTDAQDGKFCVVEFAALTSDIVPPLPDLELPAPDNEPAWQDHPAEKPVNVAHPALGATASGGSSPNNLIDGDLSDANYAEAPLGEPLTVTLDQAYDLAAVRISLPATGDRTYRYRLEGSADGQTWDLLDDRTQSDQSGVQEIELGGRQAKAIRITGTAAPPQESFRVVAIEALASGAVRISDTAIPVSLQNETAERNVALALYGGRLEHISSSRSASNDGLHLIDGLPSAGWLSDNGSLPQDIVLSFSARRAALLDGIDLYPPAEGNAPALVEVATATGTAGEAWQRIGRYALFPPANCGAGCYGVQRIAFPPVMARAVRLRVLKAYGAADTQVGIGEIVVREAGREGYASILPYRRADFAGGINIAALAGKIERVVPPDSESKEGPSNLIDGLSGGGYWAPADDMTTPEIVLSFADGRTALIGGVALSPNGGYSNFSQPGNARWTSLAEVWASEESPTSGYRWVGRYRLDQADKTQVFAFEPVRAKYVRLLLLATQQPNPLGAVLGEIEVLEATAPDYVSVLADKPPNLLDYRFSGHVVVPFGDRRTDLIDGTTLTPGWSADATHLPISLTFAFRNNQPRRFDAVGFNPKTDQDPASWAREVKVMISDHPVRDFRSLGEFAIAPEDRVQYLTFPAITARYVKVQILALNGESQIASLGEVAVREAPMSGDLSVLARRIHPLVDEDIVATAKGTVETSGLQESEPNDDMAHATPLPLGQTMNGKATSPLDADWYAIDTTNAPSDALTLSIEQQPMLRLGLDLFGPSSQIATPALYDRNAPRADLTWQLPRGLYYAKLSSPTDSIVFIVDRSGSVSDVRGKIAEAAAHFARTLDPDETVSFTSMDGEVFNEFSNDRAVLIEAAGKTAQGSGGSAVYRSLMDAIDRLEGRPGEKAIIIVTDGEDSGSSAEPLYALWDRLAKTGVRIYTVGYGTMTDNLLDGLLGSTGGDMLRSFSTATGGRYFYAPTGESLRNIYAVIAEELRSNNAYRLTASVGGYGKLTAAQLGEPIEGVTAPQKVELILDASGSMLAETPEGRMRIDVAKEVLAEVVDKLPDNTQVGLRVYGSRLPSNPKGLSCQDSELLAPFGPLDRVRLHELIAAIVPQGQTPIGLSLSLAAFDLKDQEGHKEIVLVTDGIETCNADPNDEIYPAKVAGDIVIADINFKVDVVGFGIPENENASREFLKQIADQGGGRYFDAHDASQLSAALAESFSAEFRATDDAGQEVAIGRVGGAPIALPQGFWHVELLTEGGRDLGTFEVRESTLTRILLQREGATFGQSVEYAPGN